MSIRSQIDRINSNIAAAYTACSEKGATMPVTENSANLADTVASIHSTPIDEEVKQKLKQKVNAPIIKGEAITADSTVSGKIYRFDNGTEYITERGVYSDYTVQGGKLYLISGKAGQSASMYCLGGFFDSQNNLLKTFGTDVEIGGKVYTDYAVTAPDNAVKVIVNTWTPNPIACYNAEYDADCIDEIKDALESIPTKTSDLTNDSGYITERDVAGKLDTPVNKLGSVTPSITKIDKLCNLVTLAERESPGSAYSRFSVQGGNLYLVSGKAASNTDAYCLGGFLDSENNVLAKFGTEPYMIYNDLPVIAPEGATTMIVNTNRNSEYPTSCFNAEYDTDCIDEIKETVTRLSRDYSLDVADALIRQAKKNPFQLAALDKGYVTFVFDDLMNEIDSIASIFEQYQMPLCLAAIPVKMSQRANWLEQSRGSFTPNMLKSEIMRVVVSNGGEILAHNTSPVVDVTNQYDYDFMYGYFVKCKKAIEDAGFKVRGIIKAGGTGAISGTPEIERWLIGNYEYSNIGSAENYNKIRININQPLDDLKASIQDAYTNHTWLRIVGHGYGAEHLGDYLPDEAALEAILDYCNTLGITVCTYAYIFDNFSSSAFLESLKGNQ